MSGSYIDIAARLKHEIIRGKFAAGQRFPTRVELEQRFSATPMKVNRAMRLLAEEGFVQARRGSATHVVPHPPHLSHFAIAFPQNPQGGFSRFFTAIRAEADKWQGPDRRISSFFGVETHTDVEDYQRLLRFVEARRVAGLIFAAKPFMLQLIGSPLLHEPGVFRMTRLFFPRRSTIWFHVAASGWRW